MKNKAKFAAFLLRRYKGVAVYLVGIGILFGVIAFFIIMDLFFRPWSLNTLGYDVIFVALVAAEILILVGARLRSISAKRQAL
jgi:hypothetical protein